MSIFRSKTTNAYICMALAWFLWSFDPVLVRMIGDEVPRALLIGLAVFLSGIFMTVPAIRGIRGMLADRKLFALFVFYIVCCTAGAELAYAFAIRNLNPGLVSLILRSQVMMAILAAWWLFHEKPDRIILLGMLVIVIGHIAGAWLSIRNAAPLADGIHRNTALGWICAIIASVLWTGGTLTGKKLLERLPSTQVCAARLLAAGTLVLGAHLLTDGTASLQALTARQWILFFCKAIFCTIGAYELYLRGLQQTNVTAASAMEQAAPLATLGIAALLIHDQISTAQWGTVAIVTFGAVIILYRQWKQTA